MKIIKCSSLWKLLRKAMRPRISYWFNKLNVAWNDIWKFRLSLTANYWVGRAKPGGQARGWKENAHMSFRPKLVFCSQHYCSTLKFLKASQSSWMEELHMNHLTFNFYNFSTRFGVPKVISKGGHLWIFGFLRAHVGPTAFQNCGR